MLGREKGIMGLGQEWAQKPEGRYSLIEEEREESDFPLNID